MNQPRDAIVDHNLPQVFVVQNVRVDEGTWWKKEIKVFFKITFYLSGRFIPILVF